MRGEELKCLVIGWITEEKKYELGQDHDDYGAVCNIEIAWMQIVNKLKELDATTQDLYKNVWLFYAATNGCVDAIEKLKELGADVNAQDKEGRTPLVFAAQYGHAECAKTLRNAGTKIDIQNHNNKTAADIAWKYGKWHALFVVVSGMDMLCCMAALPMGWCWCIRLQ